MNTQRGKEVSEPRMVIVDTIYDADNELSDINTCKLLEEHVVDFSKLREFDCLIMPATESTGKELCEDLQNNFGYEAGKPYHDRNMLLINAVKQIHYSEFKETLKTIREVAAMHSCKIYDWLLEVDK